MHRVSLLLSVVSGCAAQPRHIAVEGAVLGRVVIYRNGVAFYERTAKVSDGRVSVHVPRDRVDDFLKSLTVVDPATRTPLSVSIPRQSDDDGTYLTMTLETADRRPAEVLLTYVTESPAWKPSYRVVVGPAGKVMLEGWAIVDNVSGEDWRGVLVGVGASSALSFRYDLWSVRRVDRDLLQGEERFAVAPPIGVSPYDEAGAEELAALGADELRDVGGAFGGTSSTENAYEVDGLNTTGLTNSPAIRDAGSLRGRVTDTKTGERLPGVTVVATTKGRADSLTALTDERGDFRITGAAPGSYTVAFFYGDQQFERKGITVRANNETSVYQKIDSSRGGGELISISGSSQTIDPQFSRNIPGRTFESVVGSAPGATAGDIAPPAPSAADQRRAKLRGVVDKVVKSRQHVVIEVSGPQSTSRAATVKHALVDDGVPASRIRIVPRPGAAEKIRILAVAAPGAEPAATPAGPRRTDQPETPVGESHFIADRPMNVRAGSSAMVAMVRGETTGGVVYLYDPIADRGDERFAFKAVRLDNPTDDTLEPGPVTVYGDGRFIGEGITESVPPRASIVVPFALDRQVLIAKNAEHSDRIARLVTVERGVVTAELQHRRTTRFTVTSRLNHPTRVYLRHRLESGWALVEAPSRFMKVGDSQLFEVELAPGETRYVTIAEATPIERRLDLGASESLAMMKVFVDEPDAPPALRAQLAAVLATHRTAASLVDRITTLRDQLGEYRSRAGELHAQLVTLKTVKTGGDLLSALRTRLAETNERMHAATLAIVDAQEKLMLARVKLQNQLADLRLADVTAAVSAR